MQAVAVAVEHVVAQASAVEQASAVVEHVVAQATAVEKAPEPQLIPSVTLNETLSYTITNYGFDVLPEEAVQDIYKDGRPFSHFIEKWLPTKYDLKHVGGCQKHDFIDKHNAAILYDEKTFTSGGCKFMPSNMIGEGRKFDKAVFEEKAKKLIYIIVSNIQFPRIKVKFVRGLELMVTYPKGAIPLKDHDKFFN